MKKEEKIYLVPTIDTDPCHYNKCLISGKDVVDDNFTYEQWAIKKAIEIAKNFMNGKGVFTIHTSPFFRDDFYNPPFLELWKEIVVMGGEVALHPHEDKLDGGTLYDDEEHMRKIIKDVTNKIRNLSLPLYIFRSGYYAWSQFIPEILKELDYKIDISCAPGVVNPNRDVNWIGSPKYAFYYGKNKQNQHKKSYFVIPLGWDEKGNSFESNYLFCERGSLQSLCHVWDSMVKDITSFPKIVSFLFHTYALYDKKIYNRIVNFIQYAKENNGIILGASESKNLYNQKIKDK